MSNKPLTPDEGELDKVAVVGMAGRFPRAETLKDFWKNLCDGVASVSFYSDEELREAGVHPAFLEDPSYVRAQSMLERFDHFDARFFGFSPREAEITNPQHRLFLETCWHALEDAGIDPAAFQGTVGVFASGSSNTYILDLFARPELIRNLGGLRVQIANEKEFLPTWASYKLDLRGPSVNVQTACSSSLVAVHMACQSLLNGECDVALVGGVSVRSLERRGYFYQEGNILSADGYCRPFDAAAGGTVDGDGVGVVVLKRLVDAREEGDNLHAVILGSAINNDGALKVGFTAPSEEGQTRVISEALSIAGIEADTLGYVEAHGTGTRLGDPIEVAALSAALRARTKKLGFCALGSVKSNLGHLDAGAGIAGLIKTVLAVKHGILPPSLNFRAPNPEIDFADSPVYVNNSLAPWKTNGGPRRAGVSSFGIGGTNAHAILEEAPKVLSGPSRAWQLLVWSAKTETALDTATENLARALQGEDAPPLADAAFTLATGRHPFEHRRILVCREAAEAAVALAARDSQRLLSSGGPAVPRQVAFLFPGQGAQQAGATREIYQNEKVFRAEVDRCAEILRPHLGVDLREVMYGEAGDDLEETRWAQPALFVIDWALAQLWMSWGVRPQALLGHSLGEYVAACLAGVLSLEEALPLVALRGKLMQELPAGGMLSVPLSESEVTPLLSPDLALAAINAPRRTVVSGPLPAIEELERKLVEKGIEGRRLRTSHAFHSVMMEPMLPAFAERLRKIRFKAPQIPYVSNLTGDWITEEQATDPGFWLRQLREPVRFGDGVGRLVEQRAWALLEVGPGRTLTTLVQQNPALTAEHRAVGSLVRPSHTNSETAALLEACGRLWASGVDIDWSGLYRREHRRRVSLPTYPFERQRYFIEKTAGTAAPWTELAVRQLEHAMTESNVETPQDVVTNLPGANHRGVSPARLALMGLLRGIIQDLTGAELEKVDPQAPFLDIGVDSLLMVQAARKIQQQVGVKMTVVQFLEELTTLEKVAEHVEREMEPERLAALVPPTQPAAPVPSPPDLLSQGRGGTLQESLEAKIPPLPWERGSGGEGTPAQPALTAVPSVTTAPSSPLQDLFAQQLQIMAQQLQILQGGAIVQPAAPPQAAIAPQPIAPPQAAVEPPPPQVAAVAPAVAPAAPVTYTQFANYHPIDRRAPDELTPQQRSYLDQFIRRYTARTAKSKELTERFRPALADGRATVAFRRLWKEIVYPIHSERSKGAHIWDVDGNEYVDITMGFGLHFFGHSPDFLIEAMESQMRRGLEVGPQPVLAGQVAELLCAMTGMDRALFCTSGTEAILGALRVARTVTGRNKIAVLSDSFHGWSDATMVRRTAGRLGAVAGAPGMSPGTLSDIVVLEYDGPDTIQQLETLGHELAAVLVEPVRSRFPDRQPREFLHALRKVTTKTGSLLIFDEIVTGFRIHPGGAQAWFGVEADLATYGKMVAGGLPIGVLAGRAHVMNALDGGPWRFGDASYPEVEKTLFTGTYFKHPLSLAAAWAVLDHLRQAGPMLQAGLAVRTGQLAADLNAWFRESSVPIEAVHFGPLFRFRPGKEMRYPELFYFHLVDHGVYYTQEAGNCFLTTAHSEDDIYRIQQAVQQSVQDLAAGGFLPGVHPAPLPPRRELHGAHGDSGILALIDLKSIAAETAVSVDSSQGLTDPGYIELPVTDGQRVLWIASKISPMANRSYNEPLALHLRGALGVPEMRAAAQELSDRHQALRCSFTADGTRQKIPATRPVNTPLIDYSALPEPHRSREVRWCLETLAGGMFNLEHGPLLRSALLRVGPEEHYLSLTAHHIVIDGGSAGVMMRELSQLYTAFHRGLPSPLPPAESLADYVVRVVSRSPHAADQRAAEAYWTKVFERPVSLLELPLDRPRPRTIPWWGYRLQQGLSVDLVSGIRRVSAQTKATPYSTILAAWGAVLQDITRHEDIIVGVPSRDPDVTGPMVGYFINLLPVRMLREPGETFRSHLAKVRQSVFDVMEHQNYPLNRLLERIGLAGGLDGFIISTTFNMERIEEPRRMPDLDAEFTWVYHDAARIDLHVNLMEDTRTGAGLLDFAYKTTIYDRTSIERWSSAFRSVLREVIDNPDMPMNALPLLTPAERQQLLTEWNDTRAGDARDLCLHDLFAEQASRRPEAPALAFLEAELSYGELDRLSTRLAGLLVSEGVGPEVRVGLSLDRGFEVIVALLAILKAGGGYVFLDPGQPKERLLFLLRDCEIPLLVTHKRVIEKLGDGLAEIGTRALDADAGWPAVMGQPERTIAPRVIPDNLAYVLYTSGSTGTPNGVLVTHRAAVNVIRHAAELCQVGPDSRLSLTTFLGFDVSVHEIFAALAFGGCLCIIPDAERSNPYLLAERVAKYRLTTACFTPSMLAVLPDAPLASVTSLSVAGEAFGSDMAEKWSRGRRFLNFYGPTETTIFSTWEVFEDAVLGLKGPTIGRPIRNLQIYIVDPQLKTVPIGVTGEIMIGGVGLARGYVNRPAKTAEKFIPNPFAAGEPGSRLYRTGDLARLRADGRVEFLGRADGQVKLRGFRIELGEVESTIGAYPGVLEVAVAIRGEGGTQSLAAYVVWEEGKKDLAGLREKVEGRLPEYMVPAAWTELPALPRNANGKVDRLVLRAMQIEQEVRAHVEPETPLERFLVDTWRDVLRVERVGLHDNFLELGGNSINGAMLAYQIQATLGEELHAVVIFDAPTVAKLARLLAERFPDRVIRIWGEESLPESLRKELLELANLMDDADLEEMALQLEEG